MDDLCEPPILMAGICDRHHNDDCISCSSSREMNNNHLDQLRARVRQLEALVARQREALERYGLHLPSCDVEKAKTEEELQYAFCSCGFRQALQETERD